MTDATRRPVTTYPSAHARVTRLRGPARAHPCADGCGQPAAEWAYDGADPAAQLGRTARGRLAWFSTDPEHYRPLCRSCHQAADARPAPVAPTPPEPTPVQLAPLHLRSLVDLRKSKEQTGRRKTCPTCGFVKDHGAFTRDRCRKDGRARICRPCDARRQHSRYHGDPEVRAKVLAHGPGTRSGSTVGQRQRYARHRARAVQVYGGACTWCGATDGLEFDHVNNDGAAHRAVIQTAEWYRKISLAGVPDPDWQLQLLCVPCHRGPGWKDRRATALPA